MHRSVRPLAVVTARARRRSNMAGTLSLSHNTTQADAETEWDSEESQPTAKWEMKKLKPLHKQVCSLVAQGLQQKVVAGMCGITPEYVSMLMRQPLCIEYIREMSEVAGTRLEAMFETVVEVIGDAMVNGTKSEQLKGARLHLEATKRIGRPDPNLVGTATNVDRLEKLAERLLGLQSQVRKGGLFNENGQEITDAELR